MSASNFMRALSVSQALGALPMVYIGLDSRRRVSPGRRRFLRATVTSDVILHSFDVPNVVAPYFMLEGLIRGKTDLMASDVVPAELFTVEGPLSGSPPMSFSDVVPAGTVLTAIVRCRSDLPEPHRFVGMWRAVPVPETRCREHEDCRAHPEIGRACFEARERSDAPRYLDPPFVVLRERSSQEE